MKINPSHFECSGEVDILANHSMVLPGTRKQVAGRASIRRTAAGTYQAYLKLHPGCRAYGRRVSVNGISAHLLQPTRPEEVVLHETDDLRELVAWANQTFGTEDVAEDEGEGTPLTLPLTPQERQDLFALLKFERVDVTDPRAIADWLLYQAGILPEGGKPCK